MPSSSGTRNHPSAKRGKLSSIKKEKTKYHKKKYAREQTMQRQRGGAYHATSGHQQASSNDRQQTKSARTKNIDIHLAAKVSAELRVDLANFKCRHNAVDFFGQDLGGVFGLVPPPFVQQHLSEDVKAFRSYLSKFVRGAPSIVHAFILWYEWAFYELNKGKGRSHSSRTQGYRGAEASITEGEDEKAEEQTQEDDTHKEKNHAKVSQTHSTLSKTVKEREHIRALLQMCLRHNSSRRKEGQHAFVNHLKAKLEEDVDCRSLESLRETAHHAVPYALSRLLLGMVTEDMAMIVLHAHALFLTLRDTAVTASVVLSLIGEDLALDARLKAAKARLEARAAAASAQPLQQEGDDWDDFDPDKINDPTKGERNQRMIAAVFAMGVVVANLEKVQLGKDRKSVV